MSGLYRRHHPAIMFGAAAIACGFAAEKRLWGCPGTFLMMATTAFFGCVMSLVMSILDETRP